MTFDIDGSTFRIDWKHTRRIHHPRLPAEAITTCVLIKTAAGGETYVAIGVAVCALGDNFARWAGRTISLRRLLAEHRAFDGSASEIVARAMPTKPAPPTSKMSEAKKQRHMLDGRELRELRAERRRSAIKLLLDADV